LEILLRKKVFYTNGSCKFTQLTVSELREIVKRFMKEQFNVDNFRINAAMPDEANKT